MDEHPGVVPAAVRDAEPVAHAEPLTDEQLNQQISDTFPEPSSSSMTLASASRSSSASTAATPSH